MQGIYLRELHLDHLSILETFAYIFSPFGLSDSSYISILEKFAYIFQVCHFCNL